MKVKETKSGKMFTILATNNYNAIPITVGGTSLVKAGTPLTADGTAPTSGVTGAVGELLYDVDPTVNPNGAIVVQGVIDGVKAKAHSGIDISTLGTAVSGLVIRTDTETNV